MAGSLLEQIKARREALVLEQVRDIPVPLWSEPALALRIKPIEHALITRITSRVQKAPPAKRGEAMIDANASLIAAATLQVLVGSGDDQVEADLADLREFLDLADSATGAATVRAMCIRDGDVLALANAVMEHSGYSDTAVDEALLGE